MTRGLFIVIVALALAGCAGESSSPVRVVPYLPLNDAEPGRATEFAFFLESESPFRQELPVRVQGLPDGWGFEPENATLHLPGDRTTTLVVRITPDSAATYGPHTLGLLVGDTRADVTVNVVELGGVPLRAGIGAQLYYVLWYTNGTLVAANDPVMRDRTGIPRLPSEGEFDARPLKVYVGGERGTPPPEPYNSTGCEGSEQPPCYHPVIPGFDARLRSAWRGQGMVEKETLAVRVAKEQGYTYPGNEEHPLYGEDLHFLIRIVEVDIFNVRTCGLPICP